METNPQKSTSLYNNISKTGYRALFILMQLIESPKTREELISIATKDSIINKGLSKDTITNTINLLKKAGCIISRPTIKTDNKYVLKSHPFSAHFSQNEANALLDFRKSIISLGDWEALVLIDRLYSKIAIYAPNEEFKNALLYNSPLNHVNHNILRLINISKEKLINIKYKSPKYGVEDFDIIPHFITMDNEKLYVWCYNFKYEETSFLRIDRILSINSLTFDKEIAKSKDKFDELQFQAKFGLKGVSALTYIEGVGEKIIEENINDEYPLKIEVLVKDKFNFIQRILSYGTDCKLLEPQGLKTELINTLKEMKGNYKK